MYSTKKPDNSYLSERITSILKIERSKEVVIPVLGSDFGPRTSERFERWFQFSIRACQGGYIPYGSDTHLHGAHLKDFNAVSSTMADQFRSGEVKRLNVASSSLTTPLFSAARAMNCSLGSETDDDFLAASTERAKKGKRERSNMVLKAGVGIAEW